MLFKILKGDSSRISTDVTPFNEGYAYFTPDDAGFYIDAVVDGAQKRICINPASGGSEAVDATLSASGWSSGKQSIAISGVTAETNGVIGVAQSISDAAMEAAKDAELYICAQGDDTITIAAFGTVPSCDIPVTVILIG